MLFKKELGIKYDENMRLIIVKDADYVDLTK